MKKPLFSILLLLSQVVFSQQQDDSYLLEKTLEYRNVNNDSIIVYAKKLQNSTDLCNRIDGLYAESFAYHAKKKYDIAEKLALKGLKEIENTKITKCSQSKKVNLLNRLFWAKKNQEDYNQALSYLVILEKESRHPIIANTKTHLASIISARMSKAIIKRELKMEEEAKKIFIDLSKEINNDEYTNVFEANNLILQKAHILNSIGSSYLALSDTKRNPTYLDSAQVNFDKAYALSKQLDPAHKNSEILYSFRKTKVLIAKKKYQNAIDLINDYKNINQEYVYRNVESFQKTVCFYNLKQRDSAYYYAYKILNDKNEKCKPSSLIALYDILSNQYYNEKKLDSAYKYSKLTLQEFNNAKQNKQETYQLLYKNNYKKAQNFNNIIAKQDNLKRKNKLLIFIILGGLFLAILAYYNMFKKNKAVKEKYKKTLEANTPTKVDYNIDEKLEKEIINTIEAMEEKLEFLKPDFSINYIADKIKTNPTYVSYIFNKNKQETFKQYYVKKRINYLTDKLKTDKTFQKYSVQALAEEIGYSNASSFTRKFKQVVGVTPSNFIKSLKEEEN